MYVTKEEIRYNQASRFELCVCTHAMVRIEPRNRTPLIPGLRAVLFPDEAFFLLLN